MHQKMLEIDIGMQKWISNLPGGIHQQQLDPLRQSDEVQESQSCFGGRKRVNKPSSKGREQFVSDYGIDTETVL